MSRSFGADTVLVIAKEPLPGRVKTRLTPDVSSEAAARLAAAALTDTLGVVDAYAPASRLLVFDGDPMSWTPPGWSASRQSDGGLDARLGAAFREAGDDAAVLVGMDTPQLTVEHLRSFDPQCYDACLGLARDGGYWCIGFRHPALAADLIAGVPMSSPLTGMAQYRRLRAAGLRVQLLDLLVDVDTVADAAEVAAVAPNTRFAREWRRSCPAIYRDAA